MKISNNEDCMRCYLPFFNFRGIKFNTYVFYSKEKQPVLFKRKCEVLKRFTIVLMAVLVLIALASDTKHAPDEKRLGFLPHSPLFYFAT